MEPKVLVGITIQENSRRLIDKGHEVSEKLGAPLHILHIRKGNTIFDNPQSALLLTELFAYGGALGGEVHFLCGEHVSETFKNFVTDNNYTHLIIGESPNDLEMNAPSMYDKLYHQLKGIEIIILERQT